MCYVADQTNDMWIKDENLQSYDNCKSIALYETEQEQNNIHTYLL